MSISGKARLVFPGGNTSLGFYSFSDQIIDHNFNRLFILKGGPGVGKSTLIKNVGKRLLEKGYDLEYHCCSSDKNSYDGLIVPASKIAIFDGTAPHIMDPKYPGAVDEIVNLGAYWSEKGLVAKKEDIFRLTKETKHLFARAYNYLAQAKLLNDDLESYYQVCNSLDIKNANLISNQLIKEILNTDKEPSEPKVRNLFASAITPQGLINHLPSLFDDLDKRYIITGPSGSGKATIVKKIYLAAVNFGHQVEAFHCSLLPTQLEHLILPELSIGVITSAGHHIYQPKPNDTVISTGKLIDYDLLKPYTNDIAEAARRFDGALKRGLEFLSKVKEYRDQLEAIYISNMDFEALKICRERLILKIESLTG